MSTMLRSSEPVARKEHNCDACEWLMNSDLSELMLDLTLDEKKDIVRARRNKWKIIPGQKYVNQVHITNREFYNFKAIPEIHEICLKYDVYEYC